MSKDRTILNDNFMATQNNLDTTTVQSHSNGFIRSLLPSNILDSLKVPEKDVIPKEGKCMIEYTIR